MTVDANADRKGGDDDEAAPTFVETIARNSGGRIESGSAVRHPQGCPTVFGPDKIDSDRTGSVTNDIRYQLGIDQLGPLKVGIGPGAFVQISTEDLANAQSRTRIGRLENPSVRYRIPLHAMGVPANVGI